MRRVQNLEVVSQREIARHIFELVLKGDLVSAMLQPGQFVNVKVGEMEAPLLRRPISICDVSHDRQELTIIYRAEGQGTKLLSKKTAGDAVDILGPLGTGYDLTEIPSDATVLLVGGGIGVPPMYETGKQLTKRGNKVISVLGFGSAADVFYEEKFAGLGEVYVATMDGSHGFKGNVVELIQQKNLPFDMVLGCGPKVMLAAIEKTFGATKQGFLSFEERMACGIGACYACVCQTKSGKQARVCKEGPVFKLGEVIL
ncbi:MAG: dihydroorotate dehydrogenase electron transfer subunit [Turicibacter sp.]|nr:dihydroorotate dehydrogenase electron transfer subunit [Turicibacter sp.]